MRRWEAFLYFSAQKLGSKIKIKMSYHIAVDDLTKEAMEELSGSTVD
jgi:hypothetical protein